MSVISLISSSPASGRGRDRRGFRRHGRSSIAKVERDRCNISADYRVAYDRLVNYCVAVE